MVMASLAWTLKAWFGLPLSRKGRWRQKHKSQKQSVLKMEFKRFRNNSIQLPSARLFPVHHTPAQARWKTGSNLASEAGLMKRSKQAAKRLRGWTGKNLIHNI